VCSQVRIIFDSVFLCIVILVIYNNAWKIVSYATTHNAHYPVYNHRTPIQDPQNLAQIEHVTDRKNQG